MCETGDIINMDWNKMPKFQTTKKMGQEHNVILLVGISIIPKFVERNVHLLCNS